MPVNSDFKLIREKKLDKDATLVIKQNLMSGKIFVEFAMASPKLFLQKNFQDTYGDRVELEKFAKSIRNSRDLKKYFGINKENKK